jgi:hypothetical protein
LKAVIPNPAGDAVRIMYDLVEEGPCRLAVADLLGRELAVVFSGDRAPGIHEANFDTRTLAVGAYLLVLQTPTGRMSTMMRVVR